MTPRFITATIALAALMTGAYAQSPEVDLPDVEVDTVGSVVPALPETESQNIIARINASGNVNVTVPQGLEEYLKGKHEITETHDNESSEQATAPKSNRKVGYRVQVFDDNNVHTAKHEAEARGRMIRSRFPDMEVTTEFHSPYWRVKAGNFRTRSEAESAMASIRAAFPSIGSQLRVVRDRINLQH